MSKTLMKLSAAAIALALAVPAQAQDTPDVDTVVASVNGTEITLAEMIMVRASLPEQYQDLPDDVLWDGILDQLIQQEALSQDDLAQETRRVRTALSNERRSLLAAEVVAKVAQDALTDEALQAAYDAKYADAELGMEYNAAHILVETEEAASALVTELDGGADFAELARAQSTGPSGANGGELGWFSAGMMVEEFQAAVETLEPGAISDPVQTQFGWHVIKLNETRQQEAPSLESVQAELEGEIQQEAVQQVIESLVSEADVTRTEKDAIDTSVLSNVDLLED